MKKKMPSCMPCRMLVLLVTMKKYFSFFMPVQMQTQLQNTLKMASEPVLDVNFFFRNCRWSFFSK